MKVSGDLESIILILLCFINSFVFINAGAQGSFASNERIIKNTYDGVEATYTLDPSKNSLQVNLRNTLQQTVVIELMIAPPAGGGTRLLPLVVLSSGKSESRTISDVYSVTTSMGVLRPGDTADKNKISRVVDQVTVKDDKLFSKKFDAVIATQKKPSGNRPEGLSDEQARAVLEMIFTPAAWKDAGSEITPDDRKLALIFLKDMVKTSCSGAVINGFFYKEFADDFTFPGLAKYIATGVDDACLTTQFDRIRKNIAGKYQEVFKARKANGKWG